MKKKFLLVASVLLLASCSGNVDSGNVSVSNQDSSTPSISTQDSNKVDYSLFDNNLVGTWYIHSSMMGVLALNTSFVISDNYTLVIQNYKFNFVGQYAGFDGVCMFLSESKITTFVASFDGENVDWAFSDTTGSADWGAARSTPYSTGVNYDYIGKEWPMNLINNYLDTNGTIPNYSAEKYYLYCGLSQKNNDAKYCMIDVFDAPKDSATSYIETLREEGYVFEDAMDSLSFYNGYDPNHIYAIKLKYFDDNGNLSIFIYNYESLY